MLAYGNNGFRSAFGNHRGEDIFLVISLSIRGEQCHLHLQLPQFTQFFIHIFADLIHRLQWHWSGYVKVVCDNSFHYGSHVTIMNIQAISHAISPTISLCSHSFSIWINILLSGGRWRALHVLRFCWLLECWSQVHLTLSLLKHKTTVRKFH